MKKQYIQPHSTVVVVKLIGSVLETETVGVGPSRAGAVELDSRQTNNRFDWDAADDEEEW